jgi:circadian clock protein KaiB
MATLLERHETALRTECASHFPTTPDSQGVAMTAMEDGPAGPDDFALDADVWRFRLYVTGQTARSRTAIENLRNLCDEQLPGRHKIEIIDLLLDPHLAARDQVVAVPTLVRKYPEPVKRVVGDLSDHARAMAILELPPREP